MNKLEIYDAFNKQFSYDRLKNLKLEEYTNLNKNSFCYWVEAKTTELGSIWGGSSYKFGIYKRNPDSKEDSRPGYMTDGKYGWVAKYGKTSDEAFEKIKSLIIHIYEAASSGRYKDIDSIDLGVAYKWKIAFLYSGRKLISIFNPRNLKDVAESLGMNITNKTTISEIQGFLISKQDGKDIFEYSNELWDLSLKTHKKKFWLFAPGELASKWEDFYNEGIMAIGWDEIGDITQYGTKEEIAEAIRSHYNKKGNLTHNKTTNYNFCNTVAIGDIVIPRKGTTEFLGYGVVESDYYYDDSAPSFKSRRKVSWHNKGNWTGEKINVQIALANITNKAYLPRLKQIVGYEDDFQIGRKKEIKFSYITELKKFIAQSFTKNQKTSSYTKSLYDLHVELSFGQGNPAKIPWISFLADGQKTSNGIYPVYLLYKDIGKLILAYGISETIKPAIEWTIPENVNQISDYFSTKGLGKADRYGKSWVYKVYGIPELLLGNYDNDIDNDLWDIINEYKVLMGLNQTSTPEIQERYQPFVITELRKIKESGLLYSDDLLYRYAVSLMTKPFVILSGLSGSGKTKLALAFAKFMSESNDQVKIVSVGSDWNNREYLLGYPNALECGKYIFPENGVLEFIIQASQNPDHPYFLILDEMNLSYVERYFADFLSCMESDENMALHPDTDDWNSNGRDDVPAELKLPDNLFITGTINVDETTYMFSPKVLDRANTIEFRVSRSDMESFLDECAKLDMDKIAYAGGSMGSNFMEIVRNKDFDKHSEEYKDELLNIFENMKEAGAEFGYRTATEIYRFISKVGELKIGWSKDQIMDIIIMQKILPKLHGSRKKMHPILNNLWQICLADNKEQLIDDKLPEREMDTKFKYPISATKVWCMYKNAQENGFTSYAEA